MRGPDGSNRVLLVDHCEGQCRAIVGFKNGDPGTARCFSLLNSSSGAHDDTDRRDNPLEVPYSTGLIHATFFCELKQHSVNMRAFTFACQVTNLIVRNGSMMISTARQRTNFNALFARLARGCTG